MTSNPCSTVTRLPGPVFDLAIRLGVNPQNNFPGVLLRQTGRMKGSLDARGWLAFTASQTISARDCAFDWRARVGPFGMISGRDALVHGEGLFDILAFGFIPVARAKHTAALVRGELMRYLTELVWAPHAILHNHDLRWRVIDADTLSVSAGVDDKACEVFLSLDGHGRIIRSFAPDRPRNATAPLLPTPWRGHFSDYQSHGGIWLPSSAEVAWDVDGQRKPYWEGRLAHWEMRTAPPSH